MTRIWRLIVVVGVEVSEVGIGVGFPGQLRVEVLVPLLQHQVVFVEGLRGGKQRAQWWAVGAESVRDPPLSCDNSRKSQME